MTSFQNHIILGGVRFPIDAKVRTWEVTGLRFRAGEAANKPRKREIDLAVIHWTAGENSPATTYQVLRTRGLGIEFCIAADGTIWQMADPLEVDTADCGQYFNARSFGVEVQSYGYRKKGQKAPLKRDEQIETIHGHDWLCASFFEAQKLALAALLRCVVASGLTRVELVAPAESMTSVWPRLLPSRFVKSFQGVAGHFHLSEDKTDPGLDVFHWMFSEGVLSPVVVDSSAPVSPARKPQSANPRRPKWPVP